MNLSTKRLAGICLGLGFCLPARSGGIDQAWTLGAPEPPAIATPAASASGPSPARKYQLGEAQYQAPDVGLIDADGGGVALRPFLAAEGPVLLQFVFVTCSTVCPLLSASLSSAQTELNALSGGKHRLISISIDPEQDTPEQLRDYAKRFKAGGNWHFLTGQPDDIRAVLQAFDASYSSGNKMYHKPLTFMRRSPDAVWRRIDGLLGKQDLIAEYRRTMGLSD